MTIDNIISEIQKHCCWFMPNKKLKEKANIDISNVNDTILRYVDMIPHICEVYQSFLAKKQLNEKVCNDNLNRVILEEGMTLEALGYYWIAKSSMGAFMCPIAKKQKTLGCKNVDLDGEIECEFVFDIKTFSSFSLIASSKLNKLGEDHPNYTFMLTIEQICLQKNGAINVLMSKQSVLMIIMLMAESLV